MEKSEMNILRLDSTRRFSLSDGFETESSETLRRLFGSVFNNCVLVERSGIGTGNSSIDEISVKEASSMIERAWSGESEISSCSTSR